MPVPTPSNITLPPTVITSDGQPHSITITGQNFLATQGSNSCSFSIKNDNGVDFTCTVTSSTTTSVSGTYATTSATSQIQITVTNTSNGQSASGLSLWIDVSPP